MIKTSNAVVRPGALLECIAPFFLHGFRYGFAGIASTYNIEHDDILIYLGNKHTHFGHIYFFLFDGSVLGATHPKEKDWSRNLRSK